ncbi:hemerythrin family protein [Synergistaceae bacterium OttesenSCG-928-I11]|nr:hemerythrin family protein [Synergistaceae bacterium OttesenSCG-928-I11]
MFWSSSLETGIASIDEQHKELFNQIDILVDTSNGERIKSTLDFLDNYIVKHFTDEQRLHKEKKYPKAVEHKKYHDNYIVVFRKLKEKYIAEGPTLSNNMALNKTVLGWLKEHILVHDRAFAAYCKTL